MAAIDAPIAGGEAPALIDALAEQMRGMERDEAERAVKRLRLLGVPQGLEAKPRGLDFTDLAAVAVAGVSPPEEVVPGMILEGCVNWFAGHPGHGKTTVAMHAAMQAMRDGRDVIWLDWEGGIRATVRRLIAVGVSPELMSERLHYSYGPEMGADEESFAILAAELERLPGALVVFDSASKALSAAGLDENSPTDATKWTTQVVMPIRQAGGTAVVIDHVVKNASRSTPYPRGAGSKLADTEVMWYVEAEQRFNRETVGTLRLTLHKDREGVLPTEGLRFAIGDGKGGLPLELLDAAADSSSGAAGSALRGEVLALLRRHDGQELRTTQVTEIVTGSRAKVSEALKELGADPTAPVSSRAGSRGAVFWRLDPSAATGLDV